MPTCNRLFGRFYDSTIMTQVLISLDDCRECTSLGCSSKRNRKDSFSQILPCATVHSSRWMVSILDYLQILNGSYQIRQSHFRLQWRRWCSEFRSEFRSDVRSELRIFFSNLKAWIGKIFGEDSLPFSWIETLKTSRFFSCGPEPGKRTVKKQFRRRWKGNCALIFPSVPHWICTILNSFLFLRISVLMLSFQAMAGFF